MSTVEPVELPLDSEPERDGIKPIETSFVHLSDFEKRDLIERVARLTHSKTLALTGSSDEADRAERQYRRRMELLRQVESMPQVPNPDGFSGRDHDKVLYGSP
jgi:hypothetical protein